MECFFSDNGTQEMLQEVREYLSLFYEEREKRPVSMERFAEIQEAVEHTGTYWQTFDELVYGAMVAWRNHVHCVGRLYWSSLQVRDKRHLMTAPDIFEAIVEHISLATNGGKIRPMMTIFAPQACVQDGIRIWNPQLIRYAGYRCSNGTILGDPLQLELTERLYQLGWKGGRGTPFDILPIVIQMPGEAPQLFELPKEVLLEVPLSHPDYPWFEELGLKWHALPAISNMRLDIGGISYTAAPFNGWYVGTEIGSRNLGDVDRYNLLPMLAEKMKISTISQRSLWKDRVLVELNVAVLSSFAKHKVTIMDHHTISQKFLVHEEREKRAGRMTHADWGWMIPPMSSSTTSIFHRSYTNVTIKPNIYYQAPPWQDIG